MSNPFRFVSVPVRRALFALALAAIAFVSLWSHENLETYVSEDVQSRDNMIHAVCYFVLAATALWSCGRAERPWRSRILAVLFCFGYGALMELLQMLPVVGRNCSLKDILDNLLGAAIACLLFPRAWWPGESPESEAPPLP